MIQELTFLYSWEMSKNMFLYLLTKGHFFAYNFLSKCMSTFSHSFKHIYVFIATCIIKLMIKNLLSSLSKKQKTIRTRVPLSIKRLFSPPKQITTPSTLLPSDRVHLKTYFSSNSEKKTPTYTSILTIFISIFITCPSMPAFVFVLNMSKMRCFHTYQKNLEQLRNSPKFKFHHLVALTGQNPFPKWNLDHQNFFSLSSFRILPMGLCLQKKYLTNLLVHTNPTNFILSSGKIDKYVEIAKNIFDYF